MNPDIKTTNVRFNLDKSDQRKAWTYLQTMDKQRFRSYSNVICLALVDYFDRYYKTEEDPYFENRQREDRFVQQIVDAVSSSLKETIPLFLAGCLTGASVQPAHVPVSKAEDGKASGLSELVSSDIDWDFLGE